MPDVTAIASEPPIRIRIVGGKGLVPEILAPMTPAKAKPITVTTMMLTPRLIRVGMNMPIIGIKPPAVNAAADAMAAWIGRAFVKSC